VTGFDLRQILTEVFRKLPSNKLSGDGDCSLLGISGGFGGVTGMNNFNFLTGDVGLFTSSSGRISDIYSGRLIGDFTFNSTRNEKCLVIKDFK
jgi:hypothetical protein